MSEYQSFDREPTSLPLYHTLPEVYAWKSNWASERPNSLACQSKILLETRGDGLSMLKLSLKHVGRGKRTFPVSDTLVNVEFIGAGSQGKACFSAKKHGREEATSASRPSNVESSF